MISQFTGEYRFLSNFWTCYINFDGTFYPSVENAYQAAKCYNYSDRKQFESCKASEAKRLGQIVQLRPDWEKIKLSNMKFLVAKKFEDEFLRKKLVATYNEELQEGNWWGDRFWGTVNGYGQNHLGKILMDVREEIILNAHRTSR